jgi:hypothetical protein
MKACPLGTAVTRPRHLCERGTQLYGTPPCQSTGGADLHRAVLGQPFQVLEPASLEATARDGRRRAAAPPPGGRVRAGT